MLAPNLALVLTMVSTDPLEQDDQSFDLLLEKTGQQRFREC